MNSIPSRLVKLRADPAPATEQIYLETADMLAASPLLPDWMIGDLTLALAGNHAVPVPAENLPGYSDFVQRLMRRSGRWQYIVARLGQVARQRQSEQLWRRMSVRILYSAFTLLLQRSAGKTPEGKIPGEEQMAELLASAYLEAAGDEEDFSSVLLDDLGMAVFELARRARSTEFLDQLSAKDLIKACLEMPLDNNTYRPRLLRETLRPGDRKPRLPGDHLSLRAVSLKVRDDQIPKILPSELATNRWRGSIGRRLTMDKVLNRRPTIYQNHDTQIPELNHRILMVFINNVPRDPSAGPVDMAEMHAKAMGFGLLVNAALKVPHESIHADVAWFQRDDPMANHIEWGAQFRLSTLKVTRSEGERWRNVLELDRVLPRWFVKAVGGIREHATSDYMLLRDNPSDYLTKACNGKYHGIFVVGIAREGEGASVVPSTGTALPELPPGTPLAMLITTGADARRTLRGATFTSLLAARMAPSILPPVPAGAEPHGYFVEEFLKMIIGPIERKAATQPLDKTKLPL